jgi:hypothetical protein
MLALKSAINAVANSNMEIILTPYAENARCYRSFVKSSAFQDGFIAPEKWFRCGSSSVVVFFARSVWRPGHIVGTDGQDW